MTLFTGEDIATKDPDAVDWPQGIDWTTECANRGTGVTIIASTWLISHDQLLTFADDSIVIGGLQTQVKFSGGTRGVKYRATNRVTYSDGGQDDRTIQIFIEDT